MEQPIKKNKFSYFARSLLRLPPQEIWERDYLIFIIKLSRVTYYYHISASSPFELANDL